MYSIIKSIGLLYITCLANWDWRFSLYLGFSILLRVGYEYLAFMASESCVFILRFVYSTWVSDA